MFLENRPASQSRSRSRRIGPQGVSSDRRSRRHLRELCDEVLASYRVASGQDPITDGDRAEARAILSKFAPSMMGRPI
jgi:hypothetical protein